MICFEFTLSERYWCICVLNIQDKDEDEQVSFFFLSGGWFGCERRRRRCGRRLVLRRAVRRVRVTRVARWCRGSAESRRGLRIVACLLSLWLFHGFFVKSLLLSWRSFLVSKLTIFACFGSCFELVLLNMTSGITKFCAYSCWKTSKPSNWGLSMLYEPT